MEAEDIFETLESLYQNAGRLYPEEMNIHNTSLSDDILLIFVAK
jgi:hypothetical protein